MVLSICVSSNGQVNVISNDLEQHLSDKLIQKKLFSRAHQELQMSQQLSQQQPILLTNGINSSAVKTDHEEVDLKIRKLEQVRLWKNNVKKSFQGDRLNLKYSFYCRILKFVPCVPCCCYK